MTAEASTIGTSVTRRAGGYAPAALAAAGVALQLAYPLLTGATRDRVTVAIVVVFAATALWHAGRTRGAGFAVGLFLLTAGLGFAFEQLGVHTGVPFGDYSYRPGLGPSWFGVPPLVALAWLMLAWPAALAARVLVRGRVRRVLVGAWALAATDLFLDPQMVRAGYWHWASTSPHLPGVDGVPLSNYAGWLLAALLISVALQALLDGHGVDNSQGVDNGQEGCGSDRLPLLVYCWLCVGWTVALALFLDLPYAAGWGAAATAVIVVPLVARLRDGTA